ncbi:hypothetical protein HBZC1_15830 [Helicobacter bizzozeronii CIII-1]|uniref:Uncharacterized protein n=1 Tax=Helicobacter bizzozeronii (strain CIII-1) TaxID=1002804 RepID=F8KP64_HELBC|nr:hypothetical protein HBZC1_15830 [Helicobacter bizzozeronii CIII-1]CCF79625.1 hypothetical protein HBZS_100730 [Helicobacter bizzozeronii CCUG 35545]
MVLNENSSFSGDSGIHQKAMQETRALINNVILICLAVLLLGLKQAQIDH